MKTEWIITISRTRKEDKRRIVYGTENQVKKYLIYLIRSDREKDKEHWKYGTEKLSDLGVDNGDIYGKSTFNDHMIYYWANKVDVTGVKDLSKDPRCYRR